MARTVKIGMIGTGFIGQLAHLMNYIEIPDCEVVAVAEFRPELRKKVCARYGIKKGYENHHQLLADKEIEAVVVVTPRPYTGPVVLDALRAGKHVISEKPMTGTSEQAAKLVEEAKKNKLHYVVGYMKRYDEGVQQAKKILDTVLSSGELGKILYARTQCLMGESYANADGHVVTTEKAPYENAGWPVTPEWISESWKANYASYVNTFSHNTNLLRYLFDETPSVEFARMTRSPAHLAVLSFSGKQNQPFHAIVETGKSTSRDWVEHTEIFFTDGRISIKTPPALLKNVPAQVTVYRAGAMQEISSPQISWSWAFRRQAQAFINTVRDGTPSLSSGADSMIDLELIEKIWSFEKEACAQA